MTAPRQKAEVRGVAMLGVGAATLRNLVVAPLRLRRFRDDADQPREPDPALLRAFAATDPVNAILEQEIIPQLLMAHLSSSAGSDDQAIIGGGEGRAGAPPACAGGRTDPVITRAAAERFMELPLRVDASALSEEVDRLVARGASVETIMIDLLAPAARRLGEMWETDECDFVDVTMGLWRLQEVMRDLSLRFPQLRAPSDAPRRALFAPMPGDVHSFGAQMIEELFARAGWQTDVLLQPERRDLLEHVARLPLDVVGLTVSRDCPSATLSSLIKAIRSVAVNPQLNVIIGGAAIVKKPAIVAEVGADGTGADAREALELAEGLVEVARATVRTNSLI
jgi:methanogenic corrinoid protein MtbC1